jgi:hypothetical protein
MGISLTKERQDWNIMNNYKNAKYKIIEVDVSTPRKNYTDLNVSFQYQNWIISAKSQDSLIENPEITFELFNTGTLNSEILIIKVWDIFDKSDRVTLEGNFNDPDYFIEQTSVYCAAISYYENKMYAILVKRLPGDFNKCTKNIIIFEYNWKTKEKQYKEFKYEAFRFVEIPMLPGMFFFETNEKLVVFNALINIYKEQIDLKFENGYTMFVHGYGREYIDLFKYGHKKILRLMYN